MGDTMKKPKAFHNSHQLTEKFVFDKSEHFIFKVRFMKIDTL